MEEFATRHDRGLWWCLAQILGVNLEQCEAGMQEAATLPLVLGGLGLRCAIRTRYSSFWASWADCIPMVDARHPEVAAQLVVQLEGHPATTCLGAAAAAARALTGIVNFEPPSWRSVLLGARPPPRAPDTFEPGTQRQGWQHEASSRIEEDFKAALLDRLPDSAKASLRSQGGPGAGLSFTTCPTCLVTRFEPHSSEFSCCAAFDCLFLSLCVPAGVASHKTPVATTAQPVRRPGCLADRGWALESVAARICREARGRVTTNVMLRDLDMVLPNAADGRRLEVVADGLPLFGGAQLAVDTTLVCALRRDGNPTRNAVDEDGVALRRARHRKERTYPELVGRRARARLVVIAVEVGGRWSEEARSFLSQLAKARARGENKLLRKWAEQAWRLRWSSLLAARAVAMSFARGTDGATPPSHEVERNFRYAGLA